MDFEPEVKDLKPRLYQEMILGKAVKSNTLVVLPTGLGKTAIALLLAIYRIKMFPKSKIIFLAPTKPLVDQHKSVFIKNTNIPEEELIVFTGAVKPEEREVLWNKAKVVFSTPQTLSNDIVSGRTNLKDVSLIIFDESQHATGDYDYVFIAKQYINNADYPRILGLTASPGSQSEKIQEVCNNLFIENVEIKNKTDEDVKPYVKEMKMDWIYVELPKEIMQIKRNLELCLSKKVKNLEKVYGKVNKSNFLTKKNILDLQRELRTKITNGERDGEIWVAVSIVSEIIKIHHALELIETQSLTSLHSYMKKIIESSRTTKTKSVKNLVEDEYFKAAFYLCERGFEKNIEHPKLIELKNIITKEFSTELKENSNKKIIIFSQYRDSASKIVSNLEKVDGINPVLFVGQMKKGDTGLSQKQQKEIIEKFKEGEYNIIVMTSVGEEGLDIPSVDLVLFYEPVPSAIRTIQRRGRTGRHDVGRVMMLITKDTRDENYRWIAQRREKMMYKNLKDMKDSLVLDSKSNIKEKNLMEYDHKKTINMETQNSKEFKPIVFVDSREKNTRIVKQLVENGVEIKKQQLGVGDYLLSNNIAIELKTVPDFVDSIVDGRLLSQIRELKANFKKPILLIEGTEDIYSQRNVHQNSILGAMSSVLIDFNVPILRTKDYRESAALIKLIAIKEQSENGKDFNPHGSKKPMSLKEQQEYIVSALPNIGPVVAKKLLNKFGSVLDIFTASEKELKDTELVDKKRAEDLRKVIHEKYKK